MAEDIRSNEKASLSPQQIRACRLQLERTQQEMAALLDVTGTAYARWERGEESPAHPGMLRLALERLLFKQQASENSELGQEINRTMKEIERNLRASLELTENRRQRIRRLPGVATHLSNK